MEETEVVICGAGPSGLALGLLLAEYKVKWTVEEDPRGIVMTGDALRIIYAMGLGEDLAAVSQEHEIIHFHLDNYKNMSYLKFSQNFDWNQQSLPPVLFMAQPRFEKAMRAKARASSYCDVRVGCEVLDRKELPDGVLVEYRKSSTCEGATESELSTQQIRAHWLVGADGKKGVVRKKFLEPVGITQQAGTYEYTGTWIAANLQISLPTPETHPDLPIWKLGISPQELYDIFWPTGWHFCTHPTEPTAAGRFGPAGDRLWRHEFELEGWKTGMNAEEVFWKHLSPLITRNGSSIPGLDVDMMYPKDCIKVLRCRPFTFVQRVATPKWYHNRTLIIGDAAHVFPPFGGQGIASGVRDALGLAWRLAALIQISSLGDLPTRDFILSSWNRERLVGVAQAVELTMVNGRLTNQKNWLIAYFQAAVGRLLLAMPAVLHFVSSMVFRDDRGYKTVQGGFFLKDHGGGGKVSQIYMSSSKTGKLLRSDDLLSRSPPSMFTILAIVDGDPSNIIGPLRSAIEEAGLDKSVVSDASICFLDLDGRIKGDLETFTPCSSAELTGRGVTPFPGYDKDSYMARLGSTTTKFAIIRKDTFIFCTANSLQSLIPCLTELGYMTGTARPNGDSVQAGFVPTLFRSQL